MTYYYYTTTELASLMLSGCVVGYAISYFQRLRKAPKNAADAADAAMFRLIVSFYGFLHINRLIQRIFEENKRSESNVETTPASNDTRNEARNGSCPIASDEGPSH